MLGVETTTLILICGVLCIGGTVLGFLLSILDVAFSILGSLIELISTLASTGPVPGCGCVIFFTTIAGCIAVSFWLIDALATCGTPDAVNICRLFR